MINKAKGVYDLFGENGKKRLVVKNFIEELMDKFNYEYIETPIFEASALFHRGVGEGSDIVRKETYDFLDRGNRNMTLRPEGTAGTVRSFIENKMYADGINPKKLWYYGPMFRYERPQSGRYRQFVQFGCECFGSDDPITDAEIISIPVTLFRMLGLKGIKVNINSLGDEESRNNYHNALVEYLKPHLKDLCEDCKERFEKNPLRILDCKVDKESEILKNAPKAIDYLNDSSKEHFNKVLKYLDALEIEYNVNPNIIRGLDYYTHTVFEIEADVKDFGAQNVMCGGGRYNNLVSSLEGPQTSAVGFAIGIERLMMALEYENIKLINDDGIDCYLVGLSENEKDFALALTHTLRMLGIKSEIDSASRSLKSNFKQAEKLNSKFVLIIGEEELKENKINIKNMKTKEEYSVPTNQIIEFIFTSLEDACSCGCEHDHEHNCSCNDECSCEENCDCEHNHEHNCNCGHSNECHCDNECNCGDDCNCNKEHKCNDNCTCNKK